MLFTIDLVFWLTFGWPKGGNKSSSEQSKYCMTDQKGDIWGTKNNNELQKIMLLVKCILHNKFRLVMTTSSFSLFVKNIENLNYFFKSQLMIVKRLLENSMVLKRPLTISMVFEETISIECSDHWPLTSMVFQWF